MNKIQLAGTYFGCWKIIKMAETRLMECGTSRTFWHIQCLKCSHFFDFSTREIRRRLAFPENCDNCKNINAGASNEKGFKYGRNKNGFIDKSIKIKP